MKCKNCGHQNPNGAKFCGYCQYRIEQEQSIKGKCVLIAVLLLVSVVFIFGGCLLRKQNAQEVQECQHEWKNSGGEISICTKCGSSKMTPENSTIHLDTMHTHTWSAATCQDPKTCISCGETMGVVGSHKWQSIKDGSSKKCSVCGEVLATEVEKAAEDLKDETLVGVIRERLPIATYAMTKAVEVYSYSDATLTKQMKQYYFNSQTDEIVILDISEDGRAMYVRYPSTVSGTGYRDCWFAAEDILGELESAVSPYTVDTKIKTYKLLRGGLDVNLMYYDTVPTGTKVLSLGEHIYDELIVYPLPELEWILDTVVTERMALTSPYDRPNELVADGYKTFFDYLEYGYERLVRVLTENWSDGGIKIGFLSQRELYFELTDSYMSEYPSTTNSMSLTNVVFSANQNNLTGFTITLSRFDQLQYEVYFTNAEGEKDRSISVGDVQANYSDGCMTMYLALPENMPWDVYDLTSISVKTHLDEEVPEEHIVTQGMKTVKIHEDYSRKVQSGRYYFSALDSRGNVLWTHVTQERQDRGQMSGITCIGYINDLFLFDDNDTIVALDAETGKQVWQRQDFDGVINAWDVSVDGTLYFAGSYAPDLFIVRENGTLIKKVVELDGIDEKHPYVNRIWVYDDYAIIGVNNYWDGWVQKYRIDLENYSCTFLNNIGD